MQGLSQFSCSSITQKPSTKPSTGMYSTGAGTSRSTSLGALALALGSAGQHSVRLRRSENVDATTAADAILAKLDSDCDGIVTVDQMFEQMSAKEETREWPRDQLRHFVAEYDADGDGRISREDLAVDLSARRPAGGMPLLSNAFSSRYL